MDVNDVRGTKFARSMFGKHGIDLTMADCRVQHGVCFVRGMLKVMPKWSVPSLEREANKAAKAIKRSPEIKEVVLECTYKEQYSGDKKMDLSPLERKRMEQRGEI